MMKKLFAVDFKRLLQNRAAIIIAVAAPLVFVALISIAVAPYFFANVRANNFSVAVWCEDDDPLTASILTSLVESKSLGGLISTQFVGSEQEGLRAIEEGAAAYIHIPEGMQDTVGTFGGRAQITYYGNKNMPLEDALLFETLNSGVELVSHATHSVNVLYFDLTDSGVDKGEAGKEFQKTRLKFFASVLSRSALYEDTDITSPLGGALPLEYYAVSFLILFVALGGMPVARITADDYSAGLVLRQQLSGNTPFACFVSRWLAGSAFLFIEYAILTAAFCVIAGGSRFSGSVPVLLLSGVLLCAFVSLGMMLIGLFSKTSSFAVRAAFMSALALSLLGGLIIPSAYMPAIIRDVSYYTPFAAALRLGISGMFDAEAGGILLFIAVFIVYIAIMLPVSIKSFQRRTD